MNPSGDTLDRIAARACRLFSLPAVAMKVLELTENAKIDTRALKECIETDPALTGKILRVVNSSLYGLSREVSDLNQALALLGTKPLKLLVLGFSLPSGLFEGVVGDLLLSYWRHTLVKAVAAREIAETFWKRAGDEPFIAGLLQDLGALLLIQELGEPYVHFLEQAADHRTEIAELERQSLGFEHTELTARLLRHWRLPSSLTEAVSLSQLPRVEEEPSTSIVRKILRLAELVSRLLADHRTDALALLLDEGQAACGVTHEALEQLVAGLGEKVHQLADTLNVDVAGGTDYHQLLLEAHARLSLIAEDAAGDLLPSRAHRNSSYGPLDHALAALSQAAASSTVGSTSTQRTSARQAAQIAPASTPLPTAPPAQSAVSLAGSPIRLAAYLATAAAACRHARCPLSVMLVEINQPETLALSLGSHAFAKLLAEIGEVCRNLEHQQRACLPHGDASFLMILSDCERQIAVRLGQGLIQTVRNRWGADGRSATAPLSVSVGVASTSLPPVNFDPQLMLESAGHCLYAARSSGGTMVKSIEIY